MAALILALIVISFFGDAIRRIHISQKKITQMRPDAILFICHFMLLLSLAVNDVMFLIYVTRENMDFERENRVAFALCFFKSGCDCFFLLILYKFGGSTYEQGVSSIDVDKNFEKTHSMSFLNLTHRDEE